jgi:hypothetical protein
MSEFYEDAWAAREKLDAETTRNNYMLVAMLKPVIEQDGDQWCVLYGENLQVGIAGFGDTPHKAVLAFNAEWHKKAIVPTPTTAAGGE